MALVLGGVLGGTPRSVFAATPVAPPVAKSIAAPTPATIATALTVRTEPAQLSAGQTARWAFTIRRKNDGQPVRDFDVVHEKLLHLIVVSKDLSWFNHLHPLYQGNGVFTLDAALPRAGTYKLYADYTPTDKTQQVMQHEVTVASASPVPSPVPLVAEKMSNLWLHRSVVAAPEGQPDATGGATYNIEMMPVQLRAGQDLKLRFQVNDADYQPVTDLEPYLGAFGHTVLISANTKTYLHSHALQGSASLLGATGFNSSGPDVVFHVKFPTAGLYKVWAEFKHRGAIVTAPFVLNVAPAAPTEKIAITPATPPTKQVTTKNTTAPNKGSVPARSAVFNRLPSGLAFRDWQGRTLRVADWRGQIPVFVFVDAVCPCVGAYDKRMAQLEAKYRKSGLRLVYVFSSFHDSRETVHRTITSRKYSWTVVRDDDQKLLRLFDAHCTTEAFLFDRSGALLYHGRIDDDTFDPAAVRERDLENALQAVLAGRRVAKRESRVWACELARRQ